MSLDLRITYDELTNNIYSTIITFEYENEDIFVMEYDDYNRIFKNFKILSDIDISEKLIKYIKGTLELRYGLNSIYLSKNDNDYICRKIEKTYIKNKLKKLL